MIDSYQKGVRMITREQIRAGRAMVGIDQKELADRAGVSLVTLRRLEGRAEYSDKVTAATVGRITAVLESLGARFLDGGDPAPGPGVALVPGVPTRALRTAEDGEGGR